MGNTYKKMIRRGVKGTFARFLSILAIVAVGTGFLSGLLATTPDMRLTVDDYYDKHAMFDIYVKGSLGLTDEDADSLRMLRYVDTVMPAKVTDIMMDTGEGSCVTRVYGVDFTKYGTIDFLNDFELFEGRLPEKADECIVVVPNEYSEKHEIGEVLTISSDNKDYDKRSETYALDAITIVGLIRHPQYMSINAEPSTVGTGEVSVIAYTPIEFYSLEVYTDLYITIRDAEKLDTFSDEYKARIDEVTEALEEFGIERSQIRRNGLIGDANEQINEARDEYSKAEEEANQKLTDARQELDDAQQQLSDAKAEVESGKDELDNAKNKVISSKAQLQSAKNEYYSGLAQVNAAKTDVENGKKELESGKAEIAARRKELEIAKAEVAAGKEELAQYEFFIKVASEAYETIENSISEAERRLAEIKESADSEAVAELVKELENRIAELKIELQKAGELVKQYEDEYNENLEKLEAAEKEIADAEEALAEGEAEIAANEKQLAEAEAEIAANEKKLSSAWSLIVSGERQLSAANEEIAANEKQLAEAEAEIADNEIKLADAEAEYQEGKTEAEDKLADAKGKIDDAQKEIDDIGEAEWYLFDRNDTVSYTSFKSDSEKVAAIARVFPIFFFLVAALVALTTMTRMVEEERTQIGTLKAIGYSNGKIRLYYIGYSVAASLIGALIGVSVGFKTLPAVIGNAYSMMYTMPKIIMPFRQGYALVIIPIAVICTTAATISACGSQLREKPSMLMQQKAPEAGKRILLERIPFVWRRLKFTHKVTARNIFRYKKRLFMTVIGIAGCSALLVTGFAVRDSIHDIIEKQYGEIYKYNMTVYLGEDTVISEDEILAEFFSDDRYVENYAEIHYENGYAELNGKSVSANIYVPRVNSKLKEQVLLREHKTGKDIPFEDGSVVLTEKMCEQLDISVGDTVVVRNEDGKTAEAVVTGIAENYVQSYIFMDAAQYEEKFGTSAEFNLILSALTEEGEVQKDDISKFLLSSNNILLLQFASTVKTTFENTVKNIDYIVIVLILAAGLLAIIVMYNLTNINICERRKELATIKVLGFHKNEVAAYIYRETTILSIIGMFTGFVFGVWLHKFVVKCAEVDALMFGRDIHWTSFLYAGIVTLVFTALVDILMYKKLAKIDMVESMKANE